MCTLERQLLSLQQSLQNVFQDDRAQQPAWRKVSEQPSFLKTQLLIAFLWACRCPCLRTREHWLFLGPPSAPFLPDEAQDRMTGVHNFLLANVSLDVRKG